MLRSDFISMYPGQVLCEDEDFLCASLCSALSPFIVSLSSHFKDASLAQPWQAPVWESCSKGCCPERKEGGRPGPALHNEPPPHQQEHILF